MKIVVDKWYGVNHAKCGPKLVVLNTALVCARKNWAELHRIELNNRIATGKVTMCVSHPAYSFRDPRLPRYTYRSSEADTGIFMAGRGQHQPNNSQRSKRTPSIMSQARILDKPVLVRNSVINVCVTAGRDR